MTNQPLRKKIFDTRLVEYSLPLLIGVIAFVAITGGSIIWPQHISWLMWGDPATHHLGWAFFRHTPLLQFPLGANPNYGMAIGSSIVYTDSIPLFALLFKPFNSVLPETFQYTGLWILCSFMLQSFFAYKLLSLYTENRVLKLLGCVFFVLAPTSLWRLHVHYTLVCHWPLLAGIYLYLVNRFSIKQWLALLCITVLIHGYLFIMVAAI
ncbi:MAG: hypothetical protein HOG97_08760, partial [Candidatus Marinimicrobia bacterium]|nr:hypothetical protein [Candidatus Neomarinimicrobiota bacterium]